jgi:hypothetical protein
MIGTIRSCTVLLLQRLDLLLGAESEEVFVILYQLLKTGDLW